MYQEVPDYVVDHDSRKNSLIGNSQKQSGVYQYAQADPQQDLTNIAENYGDNKSNSSNEQNANFEDLNKIAIPIKIDHVEEHEISGFEDLGRKDEI